MTTVNGDHYWGNQLLDDATIVGSAAAATCLDDEVGPDVLAGMIAAAPPGTALGNYLRQFFGHFDFEGIRLTLPTQTFTGETTVWAGDRRVDLIPAHPVAAPGRP